MTWRGSRSLCIRVFAIRALLGLLVPFLAAEARADAPESRVRLVVLVVFDQMRGDYLQRWQEHFGKEGFRRLAEEGAWFTNCHYPYANTKTAAGHASLLTGCSPATHGIIGNDWYDRRAGKPVYCVGSERHDSVPPRMEGKRRGGVAPERLLAATVGDALKKATNGKAKVVALSFKDRAAVLPAGKHPDACYWFEPSTGLFVTSTYYRDSLHPWVNQFNRERLADRWFGKDWTPLHPMLDYPRLSGSKLRDAEKAKNFTHPLPGGTKPPDGTYYKKLYATPFGNELLLDLAKRAIDAEQLGRHEQADLLSVSFSCNDPIGHAWGPDSQEVVDVTLRSDGIVQGLLEHLDARVGKGRYLLALTADHGVCPLPEETRARGEKAERIPANLLGSDAEDYLRATFSKKPDKARWIEAKSEPWVYLNMSLLRERGLDPAAVETALARWYQKQPGILTAYTRTQLLKDVPENDAIGRRVKRSFHPERSGDVAVVLQPYHLFGPLLTGTTHGTPHAYDTHVPLLVYGPGIRPGVHGEKVTPQAITPIFTRALGITPPENSETSLPESLRR